MAKILLVDDDSLLVRMYQKKLENSGYEVATASDGREGLSKAEEFQPHLILLDVMMPGKDGFEVLKALKSGELKNSKVVLLTNVGGSDEDVKKGLALGAEAYLVKAGNRPSAVVEKVKEVLGD